MHTQSLRWPLRCSGHRLSCRLHARAQRLTVCRIRWGHAVAHRTTKGQHAGGTHDQEARQHQKSGKQEEASVEEGVEPKERQD